MKPELCYPMTAKNELCTRRDVLKKLHELVSDIETNAGRKPKCRSETTGIGKPSEVRCECGSKHSRYQMVTVDGQLGGVVVEKCGSNRIGWYPPCKPIAPSLDSVHCCYRSGGERNKTGHRLIEYGNDYCTGTRHKRKEPQRNGLRPDKDRGYYSEGEMPNKYQNERDRKISGKPNDRDQINENVRNCGGDAGCQRIETEERKPYREYKRSPEWQTLCDHNKDVADSDNYGRKENSWDAYGGQKCRHVHPPPPRYKSYHCPELDRSHRHWSPPYITDCRYPNTCVASCFHHPAVNDWIYPQPSYRFYLQSRYDRPFRHGF